MTVAVRIETTNHTTSRADSAWDGFVASCPGDLLAQTSAWARVKRPGYRSARAVLSEGDEIVAGAQMLLKSVGGVSLAYVPKGPVVRVGSEHLAAPVIDEVLRVARRHRAAVVLIQPVHLWRELGDRLDERGFGTAPVDVATTATVEIDLGLDEDAIRGGFRTNLRRNINKAERSGVTVRRGAHADLHEFHRLHAATAARQGFAPMSLDYLERQWAQLHPNGWMELFLSECQGRVVSGATVSSFGDRVVFKLAGWDATDATASLRPNDLLHWEIIRWARSAGFARYDLGGFDRTAALTIARNEPLPESFRSSHSQFKLGFGGAVVVAPTTVWRFSPRPARVLQTPARRLFADGSAPRRAVSRLRSH